MYHVTKFPNDISVNLRFGLEMQQTKFYHFVKYPEETIRKALLLLGVSDTASTYSYFRVAKRTEEWSLDDLQGFFEFYNNDEYREASLSVKGKENTLELVLTSSFSKVTVSGRNNQDLQRIHQVFADDYLKFRVSEDERKKIIRKEIRVFIGHGRDPQWKKLKEYLSDLLGFGVVEFNISARAGFTVTEVLEEMLQRASIAFLVYTGEDEDRAGNFHARDNVIHETGLFQGRLGRKKSILLFEEGCEGFSNIDGLQQLRFSKGHIEEIFQDTVDIIYREFEKVRT